MGYFLDYELFTPCWHCGRTDCNGNHPGVGPPRDARAEQFREEQARYFRERAQMLAEEERTRKAQ